MPKFSPEKPPVAAEPPKKAAKNTAEMAKDIERVIDASLIELLEAHSQRINEGNNGVIFRLRLQEVSAELKNMLKEQGIDLGNSDQAIKVLKLYRPGIGKKEFELQRKAHELVASQEHPEEFAAVPTPAICREVKIGEETKHVLAQAGMNIRTDRLELLIMDYVPGADLATILYREVVKHHPKLTYMSHQADQMEFNDLYEAVSSALQFSSPGGKADEKGAQAYERNAVFQQNANKLYAFLERSHFQFDERLLDQIERTMELFHKNGLCFRDGHHRNFMVAPSMPSPDAQQQAFIIDFGSATEFEGAFSDALYEEDSVQGTRHYLDDFYVVKDMRRFTGTREGREVQERKKYLESLQGLAKRLRSRDFWNTYERSVLAEADHGTLSLEDAWTKCPPNPNRLENFLIMLGALRDSHPERMPEIRAYLQGRMRDAIPFERQRIDSFLKG